MLRKKAKLREQFENINKEKHFNTRYPIDQQSKPYQSLTDHHSSFYFCSSPVRKQLKVFKKAVSLYPNQQTKVELTRSIEFRIRKNKQTDRRRTRNSLVQESRPFDIGKIARSSIFQLQNLSLKLSEKEESLKCKHNKNKTDCFSGGSQQNSLKQSHQTDCFNNHPLQNSLLKTRNPEQTLSIPKPPNKRLKTEQSKRTQHLHTSLHESKHHKWMCFLQKRKQECLQRTKTEFE